MSEGKMTCPKCGAQMNHHADKLDYTTALVEPDAIDPDLGGILDQVYTCPNCQHVEVRRAN